jgi:capsular polysaccharide biosynthesis protein
MEGECMDNQFNLLKIAKTRIWVILLTILVITGLSATYSLYILKPVYEASTRLIVSSTKLDDLKPLDISQLNANIQLIETYKQVINSSKILAAVAKSHSELNVNTEQLFNSIKLSSVSKTQVMIVTARNESFNKAVQIANAVTDEFLKQIPSIMKVDNVTLLDRAEALSKPNPVSPDPVLPILLGFILSLLAAAGIISFLENSDDTFKTDEDIQTLLGVPHLGTINTMAKRYTRSKRINEGKVAV